MSTATFVGAGFILIGCIVMVIGMAIDRRTKIYSSTDSGKIASPFTGKPDQVGFFVERELDKDKTIIRVWPRELKEPTTPDMRDIPMSQFDEKTMNFWKTMVQVYK